MPKLPFCPRYSNKLTVHIAYKWVEEATCMVMTLYVYNLPNKTYDIDDIDIVLNTEGFNLG